MSFKPNLSVKEGLDHLAKRLDPIIANQLARDLGDQPWTVVLEILDSKKGFVRGRTYGTQDLQAQLRMITERLGDFGFPFDDKQRTVSTIGSELRIVRNQMAHMHEFTVEEAFRANDFGVRLLEHFADDDGLDEARRIRHEALVALATSEGLSEESAAATATVPPGAYVHEAAGPEVEEAVDTAELIKPDPKVLVREASVIGDKRLGFEPWIVVRIGNVDILDELPKKAAKELVRAVAVEIATYEGPIHLDRLVQMTAQSFGVKRVRSSREKKLAYQIRQSGLVIDDDKFVWPGEIDPGSWTEFRPNDSTVDRAFVHISPIEIANAARFIEAQRMPIADADLFAAVLQTFGRQRKTKQISAHLAKVRSHLQQEV